MPALVLPLAVLAYLDAAAVLARTLQPAVRTDRLAFFLKKGGESAREGTGLRGTGGRERPQRGDANGVASQRRAHGRDMPTLLFFGEVRAWTMAGSASLY